MRKDGIGVHHGKIRHHKQRFSGADIFSRFPVNLDNICRLRRYYDHFILFGPNKIATGYAAVKLGSGSIPHIHCIIVFLFGNGVLLHQQAIAFRSLFRI